MVEPHPLQLPARPGGEVLRAGHHRHVLGGHGARVLRHLRAGGHRRARHLRNFQWLCGKVLLLFLLVLSDGNDSFTRSVKRNICSLVECKRYIGLCASGVGV